MRQDRVKGSIMTAFTRGSERGLGQEEETRSECGPWRAVLAVFSLATSSAAGFRRSSFRFRSCTGVRRRSAFRFCSRHSRRVRAAGADVAGRRVGGVCGVHLQGISNVWRSIRDGRTSSFRWKARVRLPIRPCETCWVRVMPMLPSA